MSDIRMPGSDEGIPAQEGGTSDADAAIGTITARKVGRPRKEVPAAVVERPDTLRPPEAAVNGRREMGYTEAMAAREAGTLARSVLTEQGWVLPIGREPPRGARV